MRILVRDMLGRHETDGAQQVVHAILDLVASDDLVDAEAAARCGARIVFTGFSEPNGSWKIICTCDR